MGKDPVPPEPHEKFIRTDFWFPDGNIVIIAGPAAFKVHRGQLERHSEVFSDLFSLPQPEEQELVEGCALVELQDCPSDVFYFLSALYDGLYFKKARSSDFPVIAAVLRLASKYLVEPLRQRCIAHLDADWPSTLTGWDLRESRSTDENKRYAPRDHCAHPILVIQLALEMDLPDVLRAAFYDLSRYGPSKIMAGTMEPSTTYERKLSLTPPDRPRRLTRELLCRTLRGREATQNYLAGFINKELHCRSPAKDCMNRLEKDGSSRPCHESFYFIMLNILRSVGGIACGRDADPLYTLVQASEMLTRTDFSDGHRQCGLKLCQACKSDFAEAASKAREEVWAMLPEWFGVGDGDRPTALLDLD